MAGNQDSPPAQLVARPATNMARPSTAAMRNQALLGPKRQALCRQVFGDECVVKLLGNKWGDRKEALTVAMPFIAPEGGSETITASWTDTGAADWKEQMAEIEQPGFTNTAVIQDRRK